MAIAPAGGPRGVRWRTAWSSCRTASRSSSCSCRRVTIPTASCARQGKEAFEEALAQALPLSAFALKELSERVDMGSAEGRAKFLQDAGPLVKRIGAPMLGLMLRKRIAELAGITQAELEQRFEIRGGRPAQPVPRAASQRSGLSVDPYAKLLERVLAQPMLLRELPADLPRPRQAGAEAAALLDLIEEARGLLRRAQCGGRDGAAARAGPRRRWCSASCR